jgi:hypothetical protein
MVRAILFHQHCWDIAFLIVLGPSVFLAAGISWLFVRKRPSYAFWIGVIIGSGPSLISLLLCVVVLKIKLPSPSTRAAHFINFSGASTVALLVLGVDKVHINDYWDDCQYSEIPSVVGTTTIAADSPNVILISIDSWRADTLLKYAEQLPNLTALREKSMWSNSALAVSPSAVPSHLAILTGDDPLKNGMRKDDGSYRPNSKINTPSVFRLFHDAGFQTISLVWDTIKFDKSGVADGIDVYENYAQDHPRLRLLRQHLMPGWIKLLPKKRAESIALQIFGRRTIDFNGDIKGLVIGNTPGKLSLQRSLGYLRKLEISSRPYFMFLHFVDLHQPYRADSSVSGLMTGELMWPEAYTDIAPDSRSISEVISRDLELGLPHAQDAADYLKHVYLEELIYIDRCIQEIVAQVHKLSRPTYFMLCSDHGEHFGEHMQMAHANSLYKETLRVPLMISGPSITHGRLENVGIVDVLPTLTSLAGIQAPSDISGSSVFGKRISKARLSTSKSEFAVFYGNWKLVVNYAGNLKEPRDWQVQRLCDLGEDHGELLDLSGENDEIVDEMLQIALTLLP